MQATLPAPGTTTVITLGRIRSWLVLASVGVIVALTELIGTRLGRDPVDALRMTTVFLLVAGAAALYGLYVRRIFDQGADGVREYFEANLATSKDTFIANVSHGLRTPLTGVVGFSHLLEGAELGPEERESVKMIIAESAEANHHDPRRNCQRQVHLSCGRPGSWRRHRRPVPPLHPFLVVSLRQPVQRGRGPRSGGRRRTHGPYGV